MKQPHFQSYLFFNAKLQICLLSLLLQQSAVTTTAILLPNQIFHFQWLFEAKTKRKLRDSSFVREYDVSKALGWNINSLSIKFDSDPIVHLLCLASFLWGKQIFFRKQTIPSHSQCSVLAIPIRPRIYCHTRVKTQSKRSGVIIKSLETY